MNAEPTASITEFQVMTDIISISVDLVVRTLVNRISVKSLAALVGVGICENSRPEERRAHRFGGKVALLGWLLL
jgi:hypothetical protein